MNKPTKSRLLDLLKKHNYVKQSVAEALAIDEKTVRRWCKHFSIDTEFERKKSILQYQPTIVVPTSNITKVSSNTSPKKLERVFVFSDMQIPMHSPQAVSIAIERCKDYKPTHCVIIGDFMEYGPLLGKYSQRHPILATEELKSLDLEFIESAKILSTIEKVLPPGCVKIFLKGNHEDRSDLIISKPDGDYWTKHIDIDVRLGLTARGWKIYKYNDSVKLGHLHYTHGFFYNQHHAFKHAVTYQKNVLFGHTHQYQVFTLPSPVRELPVWAASIGCLCNTNPEWLRGKPNSWDHAFCEVNYIGDDFFPQIHRIIYGRTVIDGRIYKA